MNLREQYAAASAQAPHDNLLAAGFWNLALVDTIDEADAVIELEDDQGQDAGAVYFKLLDLTMSKRAEKDGQLLGPELIDRATKILALVQNTARPMLVSYPTDKINGDLYIP